MANPELGPEAQGAIGTWQTVSLTVPDFLESSRQTASTFFGTLADILNILSKALDVAKVFATGQLDPISAIVNQIREQLEAFLLDFRELGVYLHGDFYILEGPDFAALKGGFRQYETRMVSRLLDPRDRNRPNLSPETTAVAIFLYSGTNIKGIQRILKLIQSFASLFNRALPAIRLQNEVINIQATYGYEGTNIFAFNRGFFKSFLPRQNPLENPANPYNACHLTWEMAPLPNNPLGNLARMPPAGFLVHVSTVPYKIPVVCERPLQGALEGVQYPTLPPTREVVPVYQENGAPVELVGGADQIVYDEALSINADQKPDQFKVYGVRTVVDGSPIPLEDLQDGSDYYLQRTFYVPFLQNVFFPGRKYGLTLLFEDTPLNATWEVKDGKTVRVPDEVRPERFYVRVQAVSGTILDERTLRYDLDQEFVRDTGRRSEPVVSLLNPSEVHLEDVGPVSNAAQVLFPGASTERFLRAVAESLAIVALCRVDLPVLDGLNGTLDFPPTADQVLQDGRYDPYWATYEGHARLSTQLEPLAPLILPSILGNAQPSKWYGRTVDPTSFRRRLLAQCLTTTNRYYYRQDPPTVAKQYALSQAEALLNFRIFVDEEDGISTTLNPELEGGKSLLELLAEEDASQGIALNPGSVGVVGERGVALARRDARDLSLLERLPHFFEVRQSDGVRGMGSADTSPLVYIRRGVTLQDAAYVRNLIPDEVFEGAAAVLQLAIGPRVRPTERGWIAFRFIPQGLPEIDQLFDQLLALLQAVQEAIDSLSETLDRYIEFLQAKIAELQAFLNRLNSLIQRLLRFFASLQPASGLIVTGAGTQGLVEGLLQAQDKPEGGRGLNSSYGGGVVLVAGGVPTAALQLLLSFFEGDG